MSIGLGLNREIRNGRKAFYLEGCTKTSPQRSTCQLFPSGENLEQTSFTSDFIEFKKDPYPRGELRKQCTMSSQ